MIDSYSQLFQPMNYFLTSQRLGFRFWTKDDAALAKALWCDRAVLRFIDARDVLAPAEAEERLHAEIVFQEQDGMQYWPIFLLETGEHVGCCGLRPKDVAGGEVWFGVHLRKEFWGAGMAVEAGRTVLGYAFEDMKLEMNPGAKIKVSAGHHPENSASRAMLGKLGFVHIGDEFYPPTGLMHPCYVMEVDDWKRT